MELDSVYPILGGGTTEIVDWSLCVGAGISLPLFPSWNELAEGIYKKITGKDYPQSELLQGFNNDSIIEAIYLLTDKGDYANYVKLLSDALYENLKKNFNKKEWSSFCRFLFFKNPNSVNEDIWNVVEQKIDLLKGTNAFKIAEVLNELICTEREPLAVLSFNGEPILQGCLSYLIHKAKCGKKGHIEKQYLEFFTSSISQKNKNRLPFYYCHGLLPVFIDDKVVNSKVYNQEKLVFLESEYMNQMNTTFSWSSASFSNVIRNSRVIFVGVSLTDPNMRRWLSWIHKERVEDIEAFNRNNHMSTETPRVSTNHVWINKKPKSDQEKALIEAVVANLGVRLLWIDDWNQVPLALKKLLGINEAIKPEKSASFSKHIQNQHKRNGIPQKWQNTKKRNSLR